MSTQNENGIREVKEECARQMENIQAEYRKEIQNLVTIIEDEKRKRMSQADKSEAEHQTKIRRLEKRITENKSQMNLTKIVHQYEIQSLKSKHNNLIEKLRAVESQHEKHLEILEERVTELQYHHKDDGEDVLPDILIWKVPGITKIMKDLVEKKPCTYESEEYFTNRNEQNFKSIIFTCMDNEYVNINLKFAAAYHSKPYLHSRRFFLIDQSTSMRKHNVELIDRPQCKRNSAKSMMGPCLTYSQFFLPCLLQGENNYVKNDEILIKIILEPVAFLWKQIVAQDGVFLWRINDYSKQMRDEVNRAKWYLWSKPFKTSHVGYTAHLELNLNVTEDGVGNYSTIFLRFILGEHDDSLPLPFKCKYTFCLLDQTDSPTKENICQEFTDKVKEGVVNRGMNFDLESTVESWKYFKNDSIAIQTTVTIL